MTALIPALAICLFLAGCTSAGHAQLPLNQQPFAFVDAKSGEPIGRVLIVPEYSSSKGVASGAGHGPGYMTHSLSVAFPFVYSTGERFAVTQPDSKGLVLGRPAVVFVGQGVSVKGVIVIAPGYRSLWLWKLWERPTNTRVPLEPLNHNEAELHRRRLNDLLGAARISGAELTEPERLMFSVIKDFDIDVRFNEAERQLVRSFLKP